MIVKINSLIIFMSNVSSNGKNIITINLKLLFFLKIVKIKFKMEFLQVPAKHDFSYLAPHLLKWNE